MYNLIRKIIGAVDKRYDFADKWLYLAREEVVFDLSVLKTSL